MSEQEGTDGRDINITAGADPVAAFLDALPAAGTTEDSPSAEALAREEHERQVGVNATLTEWATNQRLLGYLKDQARNGIFAWNDYTALPADAVIASAAGRYPVGMISGDGTIIVREGNTKEADNESEYALVKPAADGSYEYKGTHPQYSRRRD